MNAPTRDELRRMCWGRKAIRLDLTTGGNSDRPVVSWPVQTGGWVAQDGPADGRACGVGLHAAHTARGLSSAHRLTTSVTLIVGWLPDDVLGEDAHKVRVSRMWVPEGAAVPFVDAIRAHGVRADLAGVALTCVDLSDANMSDADMSDADMSGADLTDADLTGAVADKHTIWPAGFNPEKRGVVTR